MRSSRIRADSLDHAFPLRRNGFSSHNDGSLVHSAAFVDYFKVDTTPLPESPMCSQVLLVRA